MFLLGIGAGLAFPAADDARDVGRDAERLGARVGTGEHDHTGGRGDRPRGARDARDIAHGRPAGGRRRHDSALNSGFHLAYTVGAVLVLAAIAVAAVVLQPEQESAGAETGEAGEQERAEAYAEAA